MKTEDETDVINTMKTKKLIGNYAVISGIFVNTREGVIG